MVQARSTPLDRQPTNGRIITIAGVLPKERGICPIMSPQPRDPVAEIQAPRTSGFEGQQSLHTGESGGCRKQRLQA